MPKSAPSVAHRLDQRLRVRWRRTPSLMFRPSGWQPMRDDVGAELVEHVGRDVVGRAVRAVDHDLQPRSVRSLANVLLQNSM